MDNKCKLGLQKKKIHENEKLTCDNLHYTFLQVELGINWKIFEISFDLNHTNMDIKCLYIQKNYTFKRKYDSVHKKYIKIENNNNKLGSIYIEKFIIRKLPWPLFNFKNTNIVLAL